MGETAKKGENREEEWDITRKRVNSDIKGDIQEIWRRETGRASVMVECDVVNLIVRET